MEATSSSEISGNRRMALLQWRSPSHMSWDDERIEITTVRKVKILRLPWSSWSEFPVRPGCRTGLFNEVRGEAEMSISGVSSMYRF
jgi:hypothetical protein